MELIVTFALQLFLIVDPVAGVPLFLAITPNSDDRERRAMALRGCLVAFLVLAFFLAGGPLLVQWLGIGTPAVRICGGVLLFVIALEMLYGRPTGTGTSPRETRLAGEKEDISITPLAIPLLAGPGAIATCLIFAGKAVGLVAHLSLIAGAAAVLLVTCILLAQASILARALGTLGTAIVTRVMGLILAFMAVQYVIDGVRAGLLR